MVDEHGRVKSSGQGNIFGEPLVVGWRRSTSCWNALYVVQLEAAPLVGRLAPAAKHRHMENHVLD